MCNHARLPKRFAVGVGLALSASACSGAPDLVAVCVGDYAPSHPPAMLELLGTLAFHDPTLIRGDDGYWLYGTGQGLKAKRSSDLLTWREQSAVFSENPSWISDLVPDVTSLWSPSVAHFGSQYHLYYAASTFSSSRSCIGHATTQGIIAGSIFEDRGPVICSNVPGAMDDFNAIDPSVYLEREAEPWLVFGSFDSGIKLMPLDVSGARLGTELFSLAQRSSDNPAIQAPFIYKWRDDYYLFVSFDKCCQGLNSTHNIRVGRARQLNGPYLDRDGIDMMNGGGTLVLAGNAQWAGPGSNAIFDDHGKRYNVFHAYDANNNGQSTLRIGELAFDNDGWPVSAGP
jgi:arabinan endo-1,5-alpha-L-arabinosidase